MLIFAPNLLCFYRLKEESAAAADDKKDKTDIKDEVSFSFKRTILISCFCIYQEKDDAGKTEKPDDDAATATDEGKAEVFFLFKFIFAYIFEP